VPSFGHFPFRKFLGTLPSSFRKMLVQGVTSTSEVQFGMGVHRAPGW
jgi:hypothetical protein